MRKPLLFLLACAVWLAGLAAIQRQAPDPDLAYRIVRMDAAMRAETVVMGGSAAIGIETQPFAPDAASIWNPEEDLFETVAQANLLLDRNQRLTRIVLALTPPAHALDNGGSGSCCAPQRHTTYRMLRHYGDNALIDGDWRSALVSLVPTGEADWIGLLAQVGLANGRSVQRADAEALWLDRAMAARPAPEQNDEAIEARQSEIASLAYRDPTIPDRVASAVSSLARRMDRRGGTLVIVAMPLDASLAGRIDGAAPDWNRGFADLLASARQSGGTVLDLTRDPRLTSDTAGFSDPVHLNRSGARALTAVLEERLIAGSVR